MSINNEQNCIGTKIDLEKYKWWLEYETEPHGKHKAASSDNCLLLTGNGYSSDMLWLLLSAQYCLHNVLKICLA